MPPLLFLRSFGFAMQALLSVIPVLAYLSITWTVYPFLSVCCLPILIMPASLSYSIFCLPPASTLSMNSVYEFALTSLYLTPVTDLCLSDLSCESIKLHMDPGATASASHILCVVKCSYCGGFAAVWLITPPK